MHNYSKKFKFKNGQRSRSAKVSVEIFMQPYTIILKFNEVHSQKKESRLEDDWKGQVT